MENEKALFRQQALDALSQTDEINTLVSVTTVKSWILLVILLFVIIAVILWGIFGSIPIRVQGRGILLSGNGGVYHASAPEGSGRISKITVERGETVIAGQVIAELLQPELEEKIIQTKKYLENLQNEYKKLSNLSESEIQQRKITFEEQNQIIKNMLAVETKNLALQKDLMDVFEKSYKEGLATKEKTTAVQSNYFQTKNKIEQFNDRLIQGKIDEKNFVDQWRERLRQLDLTIKEEEFRLNELISQLKLSIVVKSPVDGIITAIQHTVGDTVTSGVAIVNIANANQSLEAVIYLSSQDGKLVKAGMQALIIPSTIKEEEFGSILGIVTSVSAYPETKTNMVALLKNNELATEFLNKGTLLATHIKLIKDEKTFSGYAWSSSKGPKLKISAGTLANARITIKNKQPFALFIPALKKLSGI